MGRYLLTRLAFALLLVFIVSSAALLLTRIVPGNFADQECLTLSAEQCRGLRDRLGLDRPLVEQYVSWISKAVRFDFGQSLLYSRPVGALIGERALNTALLATIALLLATIIGIPLGIAAAVWRGTIIDHTAMTVALTGVSVPNFWLGPLLAIVFSIELGWLPVSGRGTWAHLVLPAISLGAGLAAILARMTRATLLEELREQYVTAARARGASRSRAVLRHAFRNSLIPIVTLIGLQFGAVLTGAVITETVFSWPGIGRLLVQSIGFRDYPIVQGCILLIATTYVGVNLLTDLVYGVIDPRIRYE